jgi:hypothetical protein
MIWSIYEIIYYYIRIIFSKIALILLGPVTKVELAGWNLVKLKPPMLIPPATNSWSAELKIQVFINQLIFPKIKEKIVEVVSYLRGIIKCAQEKNKTVLMNFLTVLMDL